MARTRNLSVIALLLFSTLLFSTLLWGTLVAGHIHIDNSDHFCESCLLPQVANVGEPPTFKIAALPTRHAVSQSIASPSLPVVIHYRSRAPPV